MVDTNTVHVVSFIAILLAVLGVNGIVFYFQHPLTEQEFMWLSFVDITAFAGLSYYGIQVAVNQSGANVTTTPLTPAQSAALTKLTSSA